LVVEDFDGDGRPDVAATSGAINDMEQGAELYLLVNRGDGTLAETARYFDVGLKPRSPRAADFDGDGRLDLAVADAGGDDLRVAMGGVDGPEFRAIPRVRLPWRPETAVLGDFDRNGLPDLAVSAFLGSDTIQLLLGDPERPGTFGEP